MRSRREVLGTGEISCVGRLKTWESGEGEERRGAGVSPLRVIVRLFASFRELVGASEVEIELNAEDTLRDVLLKVFEDACDKIFEDASAKKLRDYVVVLRNRRHVQDIFTKLEDGDEISIFPPASGG